MGGQIIGGDGTALVTAHLSAFAHADIAATKAEVDLLQPSTFVEVMRAVDSDSAPRFLNTTGAITATMANGQISLRTFTVDRDCTGLVFEFASIPTDAGHATPTGTETGAFTIGAMSVELISGFGADNGLILPVLFSGARTASVAINTLLRTDTLSRAFPAAAVVGVRTAIKTYTGPGVSCVRASDTLTATGHGFAVGDRITPSATACGLTAGTAYYVIAENFASGVFEVSTAFGWTKATLSAGTVVMIYLSYAPCRYAYQATDKQLASWTQDGFDPLVPTGIVDLAVTSAPWTASAAAGWYCAPQAMYGVVAANEAENVLVVGDSVLSAGINVTTSWLVPSLEARSIPYSQAIRPTELTHTAWIHNPKVAALAADADIILSGLGVNDLATDPTLAAFQAEMRAWWAHFPGKKIYQVTISPRTKLDGTDADATAGPTTAQYVAANTWLRTCPYPLAGIIDLADLTNTYRDSNRWRRGYQTDGVHPSMASSSPTPTGAINAEIECDPDRYLPFVKGSRAYVRPTRAPIMNCVFSTLVAADDTYVGVAKAITIPKGLLRGIVVTAAAPTGSSTGNKTAKWAIGSAALAGIDLDTGSTYNDVMAAVESAANTASSGAVVLTAYVDKYYDAVGTLYLNWMGKAATAGDGSKTVLCANVKVWVFSDPIP